MKFLQIPDATPISGGFSMMTSPFAWLNNRYASFLSSNAAIAVYADRNDRKIVKPFLDGLAVEYIITQQLVLVKGNDEILQRLKDLDFVWTESVLTKSKEWVKFSQSCLVQNSTVLYNPAYGIELLVVNPTYWGVARTANQIILDLHIIEPQQVKTLMAIFKSLFTQMTAEADSGKKETKAKN